MSLFDYLRFLWFKVKIWCHICFKFMIYDMLLEENWFLALRKFLYSRRSSHNLSHSIKDRSAQMLNLYLLAEFYVIYELIDIDRRTLIEWLRECGIFHWVNQNPFLVIVDGGRYNEVLILFVILIRMYVSCRNYWKYDVFFILGPSSFILILFSQIPLRLIASLAFWTLSWPLTLSLTPLLYWSCYKLGKCKWK